MATFDPKIDGGLAFEQPTQAVSGIESTSQLVNNLVGLFNTSRRGVKGPTSAELKSAATKEYLSEITRAQVVGKERGRGQRLAIERQAFRNAVTAGVNPNDEDLAQATVAITKRPVQYTGLETGEALQFQMMENENFEGAMVASLGALPEGASEDERFNYAATQVATIEANKVILQSVDLGGKAAWLAGGGKQAYDNLLNTRIRTIVGAVAAMEKAGEDVTEDTINKLHISYKRWRATEGSQPQGITGDDWAPTQDRLDEIETMFDDMRKHASNGALQARVVRAIAKQLVNKAGPNPTTMQNIAVAAALQSPKDLLPFADEGLSDFIAFGGSVAGVPIDSKIFDEGDNALNPAIFNEKTMEAVNGMSNEDRSKTLTAHGTSASILPDTGGENANAFFSTTYDMAATLAGGSGVFSSKKIQSILGPRFMANFKQYAKADPEAGARLAAKVTEGIAAEFTRQNDNLANLTEDSFALLNTQTGKFELDVDKMRKKLSLSGPVEIDRALDRLYGGDVEAAFADNGAKFRTINDTSRAKVLAQWGKIRSVNPTMGQMRDRRVSIQHLLATQKEMDRFLVNPTETSSVTPKVNEDLVSAVQDALPNQGLKVAVQQTESKGNYNALFSNAETRELKGVAVAGMTLGELKEFSRASGKYANIVKDKIGRVATPMGAYQIVGSTLRWLQEDMGLDDAVVFTKEVQDQMFDRLVEVSTSTRKSLDENVQSLRKTWEGLKNVPTEKLKRLVQESLASANTFVNDNVKAGSEKVVDLAQTVLQGVEDFNFLPANITSFAGSFGDNFSIDEQTLSSSDLAFLSKAVGKALASGRKILDYKDYGFESGQAVLETSPTASFASPAFRMASLIGRAKIEKTKDGVFVVDKYDFNPGPLGKKVKRLIDSGKKPEALDLIRDLSILEQIRVLAFANKEQPSENNVKIKVQ